MKKKARKAPLPPSPAPKTMPIARILAWAEPVSVVALFVFLLWQSWLRWSDPLVDFPRELYTSWRLAEGDLLYRDIACWYGPLSLLVEMVAFRIFGVGLDTLVWLNIALTGATVVLIRQILWELGPRLLVWLGSVVFLVVFAMEQLLILGNYNFITPYCSQATYGFAGLALLIWALLRHLRLAQRRYLWLAGLGLAITYLDKPEPLLAAAGTLAVYVCACFTELLRANGLAAGWRWLGAVVWQIGGGFAGLWLVVFVIMMGLGGAAYAWFATNQVPDFVLSGVLHGNLSSAASLKHVSGLDAPLKNFTSHLLAGMMLALICGAMILAGWVWARPQSTSNARWMAVLGLAVLTVGVAWRLSWALWHQSDGAGASVAEAAQPPFSWLDIGRAVVFPTLLAAAGAAGAALFAAWTKKAWAAHALRLAVLGVAGALMLARMVLNGNIAFYGFFMQPLAVLFLLTLLVVEVPARFARDRAGPLTAAFVLFILCGVAQLGHGSLVGYALKTYPVGEGRDRFYTYPTSMYGNGLVLNSMISTIRERVPGARTIIGIPESPPLNYFLRLRNPTPYFGFLVPDLAYSGRDRVLADLQANPPDAFVLYARDMHEFGIQYFGQDSASGREILEWILRDYRPVVTMRFQDGPTQFSYNGDLYDIFVRRADAPPAPAAH